MKRTTGFLLVLGLAATAWFSSPAREASAALCTPPACLISPGCCIDRQCGSWCEGKGAPRCGGNGSGGCCWCEHTS